METFETNTLAEPSLGKPSTVELTLGLLGFERVKKYALISKPDEQPFLWLQMLEAPGHAFLVVPPVAVLRDYHPNLSDDDASGLGLATPEDAVILNIVTLRPNGSSTVNLKGPVVFNRHTQVGKQVIPLNAAQLPLQHPLPDHA